MSKQAGMHPLLFLADDRRSGDFSISGRDLRLGSAWLVWHPPLRRTSLGNTSMWKCALSSILPQVIFRDCHEEREDVIFIIVVRIFWFSGDERETGEKEGDHPANSPHPILIEECKALKAVMRSSLKHVLQEGNKGAGFLANVGADQDDKMVSHNSPPIGAIPLLEMDLRGVTFECS
ncbi:hypothetical protein Vadar_007925 [Vaccinium darrowii]|uniref:Uncharacterized protein n=1 Tax=Vaccinium darrowii TaxID=229202 RepID=A0ACB7XYW2_9ERIC|nr:hypothetical protein Vadar_007925 [Vaccinium darrowii]